VRDYKKYIIIKVTTRRCGQETGSGASVHELRVPLRPGDDHVHPDPHGVRGRRHHVVEPVVGLHAEGQGRVRALGAEGGGARVRPGSGGPALHLKDVDGGRLTPKHQHLD